MTNVSFKQYQGKRVFISGGLGFIGSSLAHALVQYGALITIFDLGLSNSNPNLTNIEEIKKGVRLVAGDIRKQETLAEALDGQEIIFNLAGLSSHIESNRDPLTDLDVNLKGQLNLLRAVRTICPKAKVIFAGSRAQYGKPKELPVTEETPMEPVDIYGAHKIVGEYYHMLYFKHFNINVTCLRKTNTYGPRHQMQHANFGVQNYFIRLALDDQPIVLYDGGNQLRDYVYINDTVNAYLLCGIDQRSNGKVYVLGGGNHISLVDYAKKVIQTVGSGSIKTESFTPERKAIEIGDYYANFNKIKNELGWEPYTSLDEGLKETIEFYRQNKSKYW